MGKGKTTALIKNCNHSMYGKDSNRRFIIAVTLKTEIERIRNEVKCKTQNINGHKLEDLKKQIKNGENIVCTHSLFNMFDNEVVELIKNSSYAYDLYHDEQPITYTGTFGGTWKGNFSGKASGKTKVERAWNEELLARIGKDEIYSLFKAGILVRKNPWLDAKESFSEDVVRSREIILNQEYAFEKSKNVFQALYDFIKTHTLYGYGENESKDGETPTVLLSFTKIDLFNAFNEVWILSYLLKDSILDNYLKLSSVNQEDIKYYHVENNEFIFGYKFEYPSNLRRLNVCCENNNELDMKLTKGKYAEFKEEDFSNLYSCGRRLVRQLTNKEPSAKNCIVTTFSGYESKIKQGNKKYALKSFVPCNIKATNDYQDINIVLYFCDRHANPLLINFFKQVNIDFDEILFSLSEIVQLVWRSNIRVQESEKPVFVFIPNKRTRNIFNDWLIEGKNQEILKERNLPTIAE